MTTFILPPAGVSPGPRKRGVYCTVLSDIARAAADALDALETFAELLRGDRQAGFAKFDAHVGETGCHLRATMLREAFLVCKNDLRNSTTLESLPNWIVNAIAHLLCLRRNAEQLCLQLSKYRSDPRDVGVGLKRDTPEHIIRVLLGGQITDPDHTDNRFDSSTVRFGCLNDCARATWNLQSPAVLIRFIVYCHALSKYKKFFVGANGGGCRLRLDSVIEQGQRLIEPFWDLDNKEYTVAKITRIKSEFAALQVWISQLSCSWLELLSYRFSSESLHSSLVRQSIEASSKGIVSSACFPTFLLLRDVWASSSSAIILVDRHFCSHGWHYNVVTCDLRVLNPCSAKSYIRMAWDLQETDISTLAKDKGDVNPHIILMGNSIRGSNSTYVGRVLAGEQGSRTSRPHRDENCAENISHQSEFISADHDRLSMAFFAAHKSYSIPLDHGKTESEVIQFLLAKFHNYPEAEAFKKMWEKLPEDASILGAGKDNLKIIGWQHIFAETKRGLARLLKKGLADENLMILSA